MRMAFFGVLGLAAIVLSTALLAGFAFKLAGLGLLAVLTVAGVTFLVDQIREDRGPRGTLKLDRKVPRNTMRHDPGDYGESVRR
jgi:hypothetical protein